MFDKLFARIESLFKRYVSSWVIFAVDLFISCVCSLVIIGTLNFIDSSGAYTRYFLLIWMLSAFVGTMIWFYIFKSHHIIIRHSSIRDTARLGAAVFGKVLVIGVVIALVGRWDHMTLLALFVDFLLTLFALIAVRVAMILAYDALKKRIKSSRKSISVMIYGTSDKAVALVDRLANSPHYSVVGFISVHHQNKKFYVKERPVIHCSDSETFETIVDRFSLGAILFATNDDAATESDRLVKFASDCGVKLLIAPMIDEVVDGRIQKSKIREVNIEDLLGREEIKISLDNISQDLSGKVIMVTGAAGSIGSELCRLISVFKPERLILFDNAESPMHNLRLELEEKYPYLNFLPVIGDVRQEMRVDYAFRKFKPQIVFHAAAYKHVPLMEENPCEAVLVNVIGSRNVADKCIEYGAEKMVMISTDKAVNPTNIMGCSKRLAEIYVQSLGLAIENGTKTGKTRFVTTRFGNVLGSNGSVIPRFREQIAKGGPVTVTHPDINRYFMSIPEACRLVMEAAVMSEGNQIFVFDMGKPVKIDTLARRMITLAGLVPDEDIAIEYTGLRPGEKLYEEVLASAENTEPTAHKRIRVARVREYDYETAVQSVDELERLSRAVDIPNMVRLMKEIVPEFISRNSRFEEYDKK